MPTNFSCAMARSSAHMCANQVRRVDAYEEIESTRIYNGNLARIHEKTGIL